MHRFLASPIDGNRTAVRAHDGHALGAGFVGQATEVSVHDRRDVSIHDRRGGALVLAEFRDQMARDRDRQPGRLDGACDRLFMVRVRIRVQQRYRDSVSPAREDTTRELAQLGVVERIDQLTSWAEATGDAQSVVPVDERRKSVTYQRVQLRTILTADLDDVFETPVRDEHHRSPPAFEQRVGRDRGAHLDGVDHACRYRRAAVEAVTTTGSVTLVQDDTLQVWLGSWARLLDDMAEDQTEARTIESLQMVPALSRQVNLRPIYDDVLAWAGEEEPSALMTSNSRLHAGRLHSDRLDPAHVEPVSQRVKVRREAPRLAYRLIVAILRNRDLAR